MNNSDGKVLISVIIPVKNGMDTLQACLDSLLHQTIMNRMEIIAIDSGSTDGSLELLKQYPVIIHSIEPSEFNHGETRNLGVSLAKGEFVYMTVQDASLVEVDCLEKMMAHFSDPLVAGVCGQQIVGKDKAKNPLQWFRPVSEAEPIFYHFEKPEEFTSLNGKQQHSYCNWDDVNAMYRKSMKVLIPFRKIMFSEDTLWAKDALGAGYKIVYDYRVRVYHYHHQNFKFYFKRSYIIHYQNYKFYAYIQFPKNPIVKKLQIFSRILRMNELSFLEKLKWIKYNLILLLAAWCSALIFGFNALTRGLKGVESSQKKLVGYPPQGVQATKRS